MAGVHASVDLHERYAGRHDPVGPVTRQAGLAHPQQAFAIVPHGMCFPGKYMLVTGQFPEPFDIAFAKAEGGVPEEERADQFQRDFPGQIMLPDVLYFV